MAREKGRWFVSEFDPRLLDGKLRCSKRKSAYLLFVMQALEVIFGLEGAL